MDVDILNNAGAVGILALLVLYLVRDVIAPLVKGQRAVERRSGVQELVEMERQEHEMINTKLNALTHDSSLLTKWHEPDERGVQGWKNTMVEEKLDRTNTTLTNIQRTMEAQVEATKELTTTVRKNGN